MASAEEQGDAKRIRKADDGLPIYIHICSSFLVHVFTIVNFRLRQNESQIDFAVRPGSYGTSDPLA